MDKPQMIDKQIAEAAREYYRTHKELKGLEDDLRRLNERIGSVKNRYDKQGEALKLKDVLCRVVIPEESILLCISHDYPRIEKVITIPAKDRL